MLVKAKKAFSNTVTGNVSAGDVVDMPDGLARQLLEYDLVDRLEEPKKKSSSAGKAKQSQSSQAAQASPKPKRTTAKKKAGK